MALERLDDDDRALLLAHKVDGDALDKLAAKSGTSTTAVAMRLARARAVLRVAYVLALRHVVLPSPRCRAVLLSLSAADRRRQHALGAAAHLRACPTCAALSQPVAERRSTMI